MAEEKKNPPANAPEKGPLSKLPAVSELLDKETPAQGDDDDLEEQGPSRRRMAVVSVNQKLGRASSGLWQIVRSLWSGDSASRWMALLFLVAAGGAIMVVDLAWVRYHETLKALGTGHTTSGVAHLGEFFEKQAEENRRRHTTLNLGSFVVELKRPDAEKKVRGVLNSAELELVIECDARETCAFLNEHSIQVRNEITNVFVALDREELLSHEGKKRIKRALIERLNIWLPRGKVENLYFSKLVIA